MKTLSIRFLTMVLLPLLALSLSAFAQTAPAQPSDPSASGATSAAPNPPSNPSPKPHHGEAKQRFLQADSNGDGKLSRDEAQSLPHLAKRFADIDSDRDGYITRDELRAAHQRMKAARAQRQGQPPGDQETPSQVQGDDGSH